MCYHKMYKILFIMFQGAGTNLKSWNEYTESKFLDRLKELGSVYTYQDKIHNIWHYDKSNLEYFNYDSDIDIDLSYVNPDTHIKMVYDDIQAKYNIEEYKFIPIGWSAGCYLALYFAQLYSEQCIHVILLDSSLCTPNNIQIRLKKADDVIYPISNTEYKNMLQNWKTNQKDNEDAYKINNLNHYIRTLFISQHLKLSLPVPTLSFVNIEKPENEDEFSSSFNNNNNKMIEIKFLEEHNPDNYKANIFINKTHYIFNMIEPAKEIITQIKSIMYD